MIYNDRPNTLDAREPKAKLAPTIRGEYHSTRVVRVTLAPSVLVGVAMLALAFVLGMYFGG